MRLPRVHVRTHLFDQVGYQFIRRRCEDQVMGRGVDNPATNSVTTRTPSMVAREYTILNGFDQLRRPLERQIIGSPLDVLHRPAIASNKTDIGRRDARGP